MTVLMTKRRYDAILSAERDKTYIGEEAAWDRVIDVEPLEKQRSLREWIRSEKFKRNHPHR